MAILAQNPKPQYFDNVGDPLAGGTLTTYESGTSTLKTTYTDAVSGTANSNPITLDSAGRCNLWYGDGAYKIVLKDSAGVTVWTVDKINAAGSGSSSAFVNNIATMKALTGGYANYIYVGGYYEAGEGGGVFVWNSASTATEDHGTIFAPNAGGTGRWVRLLNGELPHVKMFGARGDNAHEDSIYFGYADAWATLNNLPYRVTESTYYVYTITNSNLMILEPKAILRSTGHILTSEIAIQEDDRTQHFIMSSSYAPELSGNTIIRPEHFGADLSGATDDYEAIYLALNCGIKTVVFDSGAYQTSNQIITGYSKKLELRNRTLITQTASDTATSFFSFYGATDAQVVGDGYFSSAAVNADIFLLKENCTNISFRGFGITGSANNGFKIYRTTKSGTYLPSNIIIEDINFSGITTSSITYSEVEGLTILNCTITGGKYGVYQTQANANDKIDKVVIKSTTFNSCTYDTLNFSRNLANTLAYFSSLTLRDLSIYNSGRRGINILGGWSNTFIQDYTFDNISIEGSKRNAIAVANFPVTSSLKISNIFLKNNIQTGSYGSWNFPNGADANTVADILIYSHSDTTLDSLNSGAGLVNGNISVTGVEIIQDTIDKQTLYVGGYTGSSGSVIPAIQNIRFDNFNIKTPGSKSYEMDATYALDVLIDALIWVDSSNKFFDVKQIYTTATNISEDKDQNKIINNYGATAQAVYTLPAISTNPNKRQKFTFEVRDLDGIRIECNSGDTIDTITSVTKALASANLGSMVTIENSKLTSHTWVVKNMIGNWVCDYTSISDSDYTLTRADNGMVYTTKDYSGTRTISLPDSESYLNYEIEILHTNSTYDVKIDPQNGMLLGIAGEGNTPKATYRVKSVIEGSSIKLKAVSWDSGTSVLSWTPVYVNGEWRNIDASTYSDLTHISGGIACGGDISGTNINATGSLTLTNGRLQSNEGSDVASATTITLGNGNSFKVTGTTDISAITTTGWQQGATIILIFTGYHLDLIHDSGLPGKLYLPGGIDKTVAANSVVSFTFTGTYWRLISASA